MEEKIYIAIVRKNKSGGQKTITIPKNIPIEEHDNIKFTEYKEGKVRIEKI